MADVVEIAIEGPGKNALGTPVMEVLLAKLGAAGGKPVLLRGAGDAFSAGLNLKEVAALDPRGMEAFLRLLERVVSTLYTYPAPTVAFVNGHAIAGGCVLAMACDHRVAKADPAARIGLNEVALGLRFPPAVLRLARERLAGSHASEVVLGAGLHAPDEARRLGLVDEVSPEAEALARRRCEALAAHPAADYAAAKAALRGSSLLDGPGYEAALAAVVPSWSSPEAKARMLGALGKKR
jgi:enoyl-CoA hydratase